MNAPVVKYLERTHQNWVVNGSVGIFFLPGDDDWSVISGWEGGEEVMCGRTRSRLGEINSAGSKPANKISFPFQRELLLTDLASGEPAGSSAAVLGDAVALGRKQWWTAAHHRKATIAVLQGSVIDDVVRRWARFTAGRT